jgi:hypothetical protein
MPNIHLFIIQIQLGAFVILKEEQANMVPIPSDIKFWHSKQMKLSENSQIQHWKMNVQHKIKIFLNSI